MILNTGREATIRDEPNTNYFNPGGHQHQSEVERLKLLKAQELGYDSTWSEVEQILDMQISHLMKPCESFGQYWLMKKPNFYKKVKNEYGVIGTLLIHNMLSDPKLQEKLVYNEKELVFAI